LKTSFLKLGGGAVLLLWANTFSPFGMNRQKRILEWNISPWNYFLLLWQTIYEWRLYQSWRDAWSVGEGWVNRWSGVEAFVFVEDSNSLSIHLWLGLKFTWKYISHSIWKRHDQRYINKLCMQDIKRNSENQEYLAHA
jgi:hypothetical protein